MGAGTSPDIHTECLNSNRDKEKLRARGEWFEMKLGREAGARQFSHQTFMMANVQDLGL